MRVCVCFHRYKYPADRPFCDVIEKGAFLPGILHYLIIAFSEQIGKKGQDDGRGGGVFLGVGGWVGVGGVGGGGAGSSCTFGSL